MDAKQIVILLQATYSPNGNDRKLAEQHLKQLELVQGYAVALLQIVTSNELDVHLRQAASICLKQIVLKMWSRHPDDDPVKYPTLADNDKKLLKDNIVEVLIHAPPLIRSQIGVCLREMVETEYPQQWPELIPKILQFLSSKDPNIMLGSLEALREVIKRYEFVQPGKKRRQPLNELVEKVFPILLQLLAALVPMNDIAAAVMLKTVLKTFWSSINYGLPPYLLNDGNFVQWIGALIHVLEKPIPPEGLPNDREELSKHPWWKAKKWSACILQRLYSRYGDAKLTDGKSVDVLEFSKRFSANYAPKVLESFFNMLNVIRVNGFLPDRIIYHCLSFLTVAIRHNKIYNLMKPNIDVLYREILFKIVSFSDYDLSLWQEDPQEYLRRELDILDEFYNPRTEAINLIIDIARLRGKNHLKPFMDYVAQILIKYANSDANSKNPKEKHGALYVVGALSDKLLKSKEYGNQIESLIEVHVIPEFTSPFPFLRERALWVFTQYHDIEWTKPNVFLAGLSAVINCMRDPELPVKIRSAVNLRFIIRNPLATESVKQILPNLLDTYFQLMNELDNDDLIAALEELIDKYEDMMAPYAATLCAKLSEAFLRMIDTEEEEESAIASIEVLGAIQTILRSICDKPHLYPQVEQILAPLMLKLLDSENSLEFFEEASKIASYFTFYGPSVSEFMWSLFPKFYNLFETYSMDVISELLVPFDNYISRGTQTFLSGPYLEMVFNMYKKILTDDVCFDRTCADVLKLWEVVVQNCRGGIDALIEPALELALNKLMKAEKVPMKVLLINTLANSMYYNPQLLLQILEKRGWTKPCFEYWFQIVGKLERPYDKKLSIVALSSLFQLPFESLPPVVTAGAKQILVTLIKLTLDAEALKKKIEENMKKANEDSDDEDFEDDTELDEADDKDDGADLITRAKEAAKYYEDENDDIEDDIDDEDILDEESECTSPLDDIEEAIYFVDRMKELAGRDVKLYEGLIGQLEPAIQNYYKDVVQLAEKKRIEIAQKKAAESQQQQQ